MLYLTNLNCVEFILAATRYYHKCVSGSSMRLSHSYFQIIRQFLITFDVKILLPGDYPTFVNFQFLTVKIIRKTVWISEAEGY
jgi:hypothetical protein